MRTRILWISIAIISLGIAALVIPRYSGERPERVQYLTYTGDNPTTVKMQLVAPVPELALVPESTISQTFLPGDLLSIEGDLAPTTKEGMDIVLVEFAKPSPDGKEILGNTSMQKISPGDRAIKILVNVPQDPGDYTLRLLFIGAGGNFIARGEVLVQPSQ